MRILSGSAVERDNMSPGRQPMENWVMRIERWLPAAALLAALTPATAFADFNLRILHTNDVHARYDQVQEDGSTCARKALDAGKCVGGAARLASKLKELRAGANAIYLDAGDQFQGTLLYNQFKEKAPLDILRLLKPDVQTLGNHEFDDGPAVTARYLAAAGRPIVSANIDVSGEPAFKSPIPASTVVEVGGAKIGVVGLTTIETPISSSPGKTVAFKSELESLRAAVDGLRAAGVDKIVALTHVGYSVDVELAAAIDGVDVFVGGHSHTLLSNTDKKAFGPYPTVAKSKSGEPVLIVQAGFAGVHLGQLDATFDDKGVLKSWSGDAPILVASIPEDAEVKATVDEMSKPLAELRAKKVGETAVDLSNAECRAKECAIGDLIADAALDAAREAGAVIAVTNGGGIRTGLPVGSITMGQVLEVLPFSNMVAWVDVTGAALTADLENGVSRAHDMNLPGTGRFPQVSGLRFTFDVKKPAGQRIEKIETKGEGEGWVPLDPAKTYRVATNNFTRSGGDDYKGFAAAKTFYDFGPNLEIALADRLAKIGAVRSGVDGRITRVD